MKLRSGDKIWTPGRLGTHHYGVYAGNGWVIHASKDRDMVVRETLDVFTDGLPVHIDSRARPGFELEVVRRAQSYLGRRYDLFLFNCEHLASVVQDGTPKSPQLQRAVVATGAAGVLVWLGVAAIPAGAAAAMLLALTGYDANVGRWRDARGRFV